MYASACYRWVRWDGDAVQHASPVEQTRHLMDSLGSVLNEKMPGVSWRDVVMVYLYLRDMALYPEINKVYAQYFTENPPAR